MRLSTPVLREAVVADPTVGDGGRRVRFCRIERTAACNRRVLVVAAEDAPAGAFARNRCGRTEPTAAGGTPVRRLLEGESTMTKDPVCGMDVQPEQAAGQSEYKGQTYYFCCPTCKQQFDKEPQRYAESQPAMAGKS